MTYHVTTDADNDPTIWDTSESELFPRAILRRSDLPETARELWPVICEAVTGETDLTGDESVQLDQAMSDHMHGHAISNSYPGMACDIACRTNALARAVNAILRDRRGSGGAA